MGTTFAEFFSSGFDAGYNGEEIEMNVPVAVEFTPEISTLIAPKDSVIFQNGNKLPIVINKVSVMMPPEEGPIGLEFYNAICSLLEIIILIPLLWKFIRFIINIYRQEIFERKNVRLLRQFSWCFLIIAFLEVSVGIANAIYFSKLSFALKGYDLALGWHFPWSNLLLGFIGLLMAQVWARGINIQEEQALTI